MILPYRFSVDSVMGTCHFVVGWNAYGCEFDYPARAYLDWVARLQTPR